MPTLTTLFDTVLEVLTTGLREEKEKKSIQMRNKVKLSLFTNMILFAENPTDSTKKKLLELGNNFSSYRI